MGKPDHYSAELPARCLRLLDELQPCASQIFMPDQDEGLGPLTATFALTMAIPIITLPYERIFKPNGSGFHYADDRRLNESLAAAVKTEMNRPKFSSSSLFQSNIWSFVQVVQNELFNLGEGFPYPVAQELSRAEAFNFAAKMPVAQWISCLRNALAHGGIAYLDRDGMPSHGQPISMYAFVSRKYNRNGDSPVLVGLNILRISQADFVNFLRKWVNWLQQSGIMLETAA